MLDINQICNIRKTLTQDICQQIVQSNFILKSINKFCVSLHAYVCLNSYLWLGMLILVFWPDFGC